MFISANISKYQISFRNNFYNANIMIIFKFYHYTGFIEIRYTLIYAKDIL